MKDFFTLNKFGNLDTDKNNATQYYFKDENNVDLFASFVILDNDASFANRVKETKKVSRKEMVTNIMDNPYTACTVVFNKKADPKVIKEAFYSIYPNKGSIMKETDYKQSVDNLVKTALDGEERTLIGYYLGKTDTEGRLLFFDSEEYYSLFDKNQSSNAEENKQKSIRLVDPRTVKSAIIKDTKFDLKK